MAWRYRIVAIALLFVYTLLLGHGMIPHLHTELAHDAGSDSGHHHEHHFHYEHGASDHTHFEHADHFDQDFLDFLACLLSESSHPDVEEETQPSSLPSSKLVLSNLAFSHLLLSYWSSTFATEPVILTPSVIATSEMLRPAPFRTQLSQRGPPCFS